MVGLRRQGKKNRQGPKEAKGQVKFSKYWQDAKKRNFESRKLVKRSKGTGQLKKQRRGKGESRQTVGGEKIGKVNERELRSLL